VLNLRRIRVTFRRPLNLEACGRKIPLDLAGAKEHKVDRDPVAPPLVKMNDSRSDMKGQEKQPPWSQDPPKLAKRGHHAITRDMDERVERNESRPCSVGYGKRLHVCLSELNDGMKLPGALNHPWREVDADDTYAAIMQVTRHMARAAADVGDPPEVADLLRELVKKQSVERFMLKLRCDTRGVVVGDGVIARPRIVGTLVAHSLVELADL
jgi:hypothetical protein